MDSIHSSIHLSYLSLCVISPCHKKQLDKPKKKLGWVILLGLLVCHFTIHFELGK
jgi:hypothetical protein